MNTKKSNSKFQRIPKLNARGYRGRVALYPATSSSTLEDWNELIIKKLLLGRVYGKKAQIGWGIIWATIGFGGYYLTESLWWIGVMAGACILKGLFDIHEEKVTMKDLIRERYGKCADESYYGDSGVDGYDYMQGGCGSVYDGMGGFGCSPHGFFGWEVPCAAAKADMEMMGFTFGRDE